MSEQLILPLALHERSTFDRFVVGANDELVHRLRQRYDGFECLWLYGEPGVGKTHLLQAVCHASADAAYVPAREMRPDGALDGYALFDAVALDDVDCWLGARDRETALLAFYNRLAARRARLVVTASRSPLQVDFAVSDMASRLRASACYRVVPLDDEGKADLLANAGRDRGLELPMDVVRFLLQRVGRDQRELLCLLDRLDRSSLAAHRRITIPFVKQTLCL